MSRVDVYLRKLRAGDERVYLHYRMNRKQIREKQEIIIHKKDSKDDRKTKLQLAEMLRAQKELEISFQQTGIYNPARQNFSFHSYLDKWMQEYKNADKHKYKSLKYHLLIFWQKPDLLFRDITEGMLYKFKQYLNDETNGETSHMYFGCMRRVIRQAVREGYMQSNPAMQTVNHKRDPSIIREVLTADELKLLKNTACPNEQVKRAMLLSAITGLNITDLRALSREHINTDRMEISIPRQKNRKYTGKPVVIPIEKEALQLLGELPESGKIFRFATANGVNKSIQIWCGRAGITKHITSYCFRHTFGTLLTENNVHIRVIQDLMGHSSLKYTSRYTRTDTLKREAIKSIG